MFCSKCNKKIKNESGICDKCGEKVVLEDVNPSTDSDVSEENTSTDKKIDILKEKIKDLFQIITPVFIPAVICVSIVTLSLAAMIINYNVKKSAQTKIEMQENTPAAEKKQAKDIVSNKEEADKYMISKGYTNIEKDFDYGIDGFNHVYSQKLAGFEVYGKGIILKTNENDEVLSIDTSDYIKTFDKKDEKTIKSLQTEYEKDREKIISTFKSDIRNDLKKEYKSGAEMSEPYLCVYCGKEKGVKGKLILALVAEVEAFKKGESAQSDTLIYLCDTSDGKIILPERKEPEEEKPAKTTSPQTKTEKSKKSN